MQLVGSSKTSVLLQPLQQLMLAQLTTLQQLRFDQLTTAIGGEGYRYKSVIVLG